MRFSYACASRTRLTRYTSAMLDRMLSLLLAILALLVCLRHHLSLPCMPPLCPKDFRELPARLLVYVRHVQPLCVCRCVCRVFLLLLLLHLHRARGLVSARAEPGRACVRERIPRVRAPRRRRESVHARERVHARACATRRCFADWQVARVRASLRHPYPPCQS